ncbi:hypothetical protein [Sphingomonas sp. 22R3R2A-7]|uniref:hypothetical protein n=1 Tax=Sphingomonas sp. 22R3R2A-7 TaxID=3050230 RepID=UPI002FE3E864
MRFEISRPDREKVCAQFASISKVGGGSVWDVVQRAEAVNICNNTFRFPEYSCDFHVKTKTTQAGHNKGEARNALGWRSECPLNYHRNRNAELPATLYQSKLDQLSISDRGRFVLALKPKHLALVAQLDIRHHNTQCLNELSVAENKAS